MRRTPVAHVVFPRLSILRPVHEFAWEAARAVADTADLDVTIFVPVPARVTRRLQGASRRRRGGLPWPPGLDARLAELVPRPVLVPYIPVPRRSVESATAAIAAALVVRPRAGRPQVVQGSLLDAGGYAATRIAHAIGARSIVVAHGSDVCAALGKGSARGPTRRARAALSAADRAVATSHEMAQRLARAGRKACVLPFFASRERFTLAEVPRIAPEVLFVGRVARSRGVDTLIEAFARLTRRDAMLRMVGHDAGDCDVRGLIARHGLEQRVILHGEAPHADLPSLYAAAHMTVVPARKQGSLRAVVESLLVGRPVVATERCGVREILGRDRGEVVASLEPGALAGAMDRVLRQTAAGVFVPEKLRRAAAPLAWENATPRLCRLTRELLESGRPPRFGRVVTPTIPGVE